MYKVLEKHEAKENQMQEQIKQLTAENLKLLQMYPATAYTLQVEQERDTHKQALDNLGVTPAEAKAGVDREAYLLLEEALFFVCGEDNALATKIEQFLSKHKVQGETKSCV